MRRETMRIRITWVVRDTNEAAMLGLDEIVEGDSLDDAVVAAEYHGECQGIDLDRYGVVAEFID
jgi:hypothetical protein